MAPVTPAEPQHANDYDDRTAKAVKQVLIEVGQILGSFRGKFAVVGGAVPWLLLDNAEMAHVGTMDIDLCLDAEALGSGEYAMLIDSLTKQGYRQREKLRWFQLVRRIDADDGGVPVNRPRPRSRTPDRCPSESVSHRLRPAELQSRTWAQASPHRRRAPSP